MRALATRLCLFLVLGLGAASLLSAATVYTSDPNVANFTGQVSQYATLSNFCCGDVGSPYTPTAANVASGLRVYGGAAIPGLDPTNNWILASFSSPVSTILVFPNIDHFGDEYDGYQYTIAGSNDGVTWTALFDVLTVNGAGEPFTLGTTTGTDPTSVNNVLTPGAGPAGTVGYEALFSFGSAYQFYAFGASTVAILDGNADQEFSAVGATGAVPEPGSYYLLGLGLLSIVAGRRKLCV